MFKTFLKNKQKYEKEIKPYYDKYISEVSEKGWAISFETSLIIYHLLVTNNFKRVLDLGSGFTSFLLRKYSNADIIESIDDDMIWISKTRQYLLDNNVTTDGLNHVNSFDFDGVYDFIILDIGLNYRESMVEDVVKHGNVVLFDDMHGVPSYVQKVKDSIKGLKEHDIKKFTLDEFGRFATVIEKE